MHTSALEDGCFALVSRMESNTAMICLMVFGSFSARVQHMVSPFSCEAHTSQRTWVVMGMRLGTLGK